MTKDHAYLYLSSFAEAKRQNEVALWRASHLENIACKQAIEESIRRGFDGMHLDRDCARSVIDNFGFKRVGWVLSATLQQKQYDGRFSPQNKAWAASTFIPPSDRNYEFMLDYALRRRFAFFEMTPAFNSSGFRAYRAKINNPKFDRLIATVEQLNDVIANDDSLGEGFCIGHSYFCTNATVTDDWMKSVVEFELIPLLKEYWFDEAAKVKDWSRTLREVVK